MTSRPENSEPAANEAGGPTSLVPAASTALTIPPTRLAGSSDCLNCGTKLLGPFCYYCGQPDKNFLRFFPVLMRELLEDFLDFDSRFMRTMKPLLVQPGTLTRNYLDGKRFRYTTPLRLYIFSSIAFFFLVAMLSGDAIKLQVNGDDDVVAGIHIGATEEEKLHEALEGIEDLDPELAEKIEGDIHAAMEDAEEESDDDGISFNDKPWDRETNPLIIPLAPDWVNEWVNDEIEESPQKGKEIEANPDLIRDKVFDVLPGTMFVLLPIVALLFKFWYLFAKKYYIEHLIFALHNHAFLFVVGLILILANTLAGWQEPAGEGPFTTAALWCNIIIAAWIPVYLLVSLKRVYQQGWGMTLVKYSLIGFSYLMLLAFTTAFVALLSFVLL
jgi:hypothetical protein